MALWKLTTKHTRTVNGVHIEKGMTAEVVTATTSNPLNNPQGRDLITNAFMAKYAIDLKKAANLTSGYLDCVKV